MLCLPPEKESERAEQSLDDIGHRPSLTAPAEAVAAESASRDIPATLILKAVIVILAGLLVYAPAFHGSWLWDDDQEITSNPLLPDPLGIFKTWAGADGADYFPLKTSFQWLLWRVIQYDATGYHLVNVGLHLLCALLLWRLFARLGMRHGWLGALIFAVHPILVESVAWISELKNTFSLPFVLLSLLAWINFDERRRVSDYWLAVGLFLAAILSKTSVVMFPFVILLYCWWKRDRLGPRDIIYSIPFFLVSLGFGLITIYFQHDRAIGGETIPIGGFESRLATAGLAIAFYCYKSFLPFDLLPIYPRWHVDPPAPVQFLPWVVLAVGLFWLWTLRKSWGKHVLFGLGFFLINLFPVLGFIKMSYMRITWVADHFLYLPIVGLVGLMAVGLGEIYERSDWLWRRGMLAAGLVAMGLAIVESHRYAGVFAGEEAMWGYTLQKNPDAWQAHSRLGRVMADQGRNDAAFYHVGESMRLRPDLAETHNNYGTMLEGKGKLKSALSEMREAHRIMPAIPIYQSNLAALLIRMSQYEEGCKLYEELLKKMPSHPTLLSNYGVGLYHLGRRDEAATCFRRAVEINPDLTDAMENLKFVLKEIAELDEIGDLFRNPTKSDPVEIPLDSDSNVRLPRDLFRNPTKSSPVEIPLDSDSAIRLF